MRTVILRRGPFRHHIEVPLRMTPRGLMARGYQPHVPRGVVGFIRGGPDDAGPRPGEHQPATSRARVCSASSTGVTPKSRLNSRLNCDALSYPTALAAVLAL